MPAHSSTKENDADTLEVLSILTRTFLTLARTRVLTLRGGERDGDIGGHTRVVFKQRDVGAQGRTA